MTNRVIKKFTGVVLICLLVIALSIGANSSTITSIKAFNKINKTSISNTSSVIQSDGTRASSATFVIPKKVKLGTVVDLSGLDFVDTTAKVTSPSGEDIDIAGGSFMATQIGFYTLKTSDYSYQIQSYLKDQPVLEIIYSDDLPLPSVIGQNTELSLPNAEIVIYDEDGVRTVVSDSNGAVIPNVEVVTNTGMVALDGNKFTTPSSNTTVFVRYSYQDASIGIPYVSKEYTIKIQNGFENTDKPTLVVNPPSSGNVNVKIELNKATGKDKYDNELKYVISVTYKGENVKTVKVDRESGYAVEDPDFIATDVIFDNDRNMSFYPTEAGEYVITYKAINSLGLESDPITHTIKVSDNSSPVFKKIDDYKIPTKWGLNVLKANQEKTSDNDSATEEADSKIYFPIAENLIVYDNVSRTGNNTTDIVESDKKLTVSMTVTNPEGDVILSYSDIFGNPDQPNNANTDNFGNEGLTLSQGFDFNNYNTAISNNVAKTIEGDYTVTYRARDAANQVSTKTYKITLQRNFTDTTAPVIDEDNLKELDSYIVANENLDFSIPNPIVSDDVTTRLDIDYTIDDGANSYDILGGEKLVYVDEQDVDGNNIKGVFVTSLIKTTDIIEEGQILNIGTKDVPVTYTISLTARDSVGNFVQTNPITNQSYIAHAYIDAVDDTWQATGLNISDVTEVSKSNGKVEIGDITVGFSSGDNNLTGFELVVNKVKDEYDNELVTPQTLKTVELTAQLTDVAVKLTNISFTASSKGTYTVVARAFDIGGQNIISSIEVKIDDLNGGGDWGSGRDVKAVVELPTQLELGQPYKLPTYSNPSQQDSFYTRTITGGSFELVGNIFTPRSTGTFVFNDVGYNNENDYNNNAGTQLGEGKYSSTVEDDSTPTITFAGDRTMAMYLPRLVEGADTETTADDVLITYILPSPIAYNNNGNATIEKPTIRYNGTTNIEISDTMVTLDPTDSSYQYSANSTGTAVTGYAFRPTSDGVYTVTYTAVANGQTATMSFTIYVGNIEAPAFTVSKVSSSVENEYSFDFETIKDNLSTEEAKNFTYTKTLTDPSNGEVGKISGDGTSYRDKTNNGSSYTLDKSGVYTVVYEVTNKNNGQVTTKIYYINVSAKSSNSPIPLAVISTILIVLGILLIVGAFVYLVRFRKIKLPSEAGASKSVTKKVTTKSINTVSKAKDIKSDSYTAVDATKEQAATMDANVVEETEINSSSGPLAEVATTSEEDNNNTADQ